MALVTLKYYSETLGTQAELNVIIPQKPAGAPADSKPYPCLYLLHGYGDDHSTWLRRTSIERYADRYGICVVMPFAEKSFYSKTRYGADYYQFIAHEVPRTVCEFFRVSDRREDNFVAGFSMGGYGALKIALRACDRFAAGAGISPCADLKTLELGDALDPIFGTQRDIPADDDLFCLADKQRHNPDRPRLFIGIGYDDFLYQNNIGLRKKLTEDGYDFTYRESVGEHTWDFCDEYIQYILQWMFDKR